MVLNPRNKVWVAIIGILVIVLIYTGVTYNGLVKRDEDVHLTWGIFKTPINGVWI